MFVKSFIRLSSAIMPKMINFGRGHPNPDLLPLEPMQQALQAMLQQDFSSSLQYGSDEGNPNVLMELQMFLDRHTKSDEVPESPSICATNQLFLTHGVSHAIELLCATHTEPGQTAMVELPTYFLVSRIFQCHGLKVEALPMKKLNDNRGIDVDELERRLAEGGHPPPRVIYIIPTHQNPTAQTMPLADRIKLANLCQQHGILLIADEVYHLLDWSDGATPSRFAALNPSADNEEGHCVSVSSFTKIFCPGVRCGWIEGPPLIIDKVAQYGYIQSQGGGAPFVGEVMCTAMSSGVADTVLTDLCAAYKDRADLLCNILEKDPRVEITIRPQGGYFLWIKLPFNSNDFLEFCQDRGINFLPGSRCSPFSPSPAELDNYARLCFADLPTEDMVTGANRLLECVDDYARK